MTLRDTFHFASLNIKLRPLRTFFTVMGVVVGIAALIFFVGLTEGVKQTVFSEIFKSYSLKQIIVKNDYFKIGVFQVDKTQKIQITEAVVKKIEEIPHVEAVYPVYTLKVPASMRITLMDYYFETDVPLFGLSPEIFKDDPLLYKEFSAENGVLPGMLNSKIIDYFNTGFTETYNFPRIDEKIAVGKEFTLLVGYSTILNTKLGGYEEIKGKGVGFSDRIPVMGLTIPLSWAKKIGAKFEARESYQSVYNMVYLDVSSPERVESVMKEIEAMGFRTESALQMTREIQTTIQNLLIILGAVSVVILLVAAFSIANTISMSVMTRVKEIGIMRSYGATKGQISKLFLMESLIIGVGGGVWGVISGLVVSKLADLYLLKLVPDVTFKPANFFLFPWWLIGGAIVMAVCLSLLAGFIPSRQAANLTPIEALGR